MKKRNGYTIYMNDLTIFREVTSNGAYTYGYGNHIGNGPYRLDIFLRFQTFLSIIGNIIKELCLILLYKMI